MSSLTGFLNNRFSFFGEFLGIWVSNQLFGDDLGFDYKIFRCFDILFSFLDNGFSFNCFSIR
jgi:hypothetical protein